MRFAVSTTILVLMIIGASGCQQVSLRSWRNGVEHYVADQANGDPSALRDLPTPGPWKGFSVISENDPSSATDVNGVLLEHRTIGQKSYFIYLVGLVRQQQVEDIRLALFSSSAEGSDWRSSRKNNGSLHVYRNFKDAQWKKLDRSSPGELRAAALLPRFSHRAWPRAMRCSSSSPCR